MIDPIPSDIPGPHIFFDASKQRYWIQDNAGQWMPLGIESICRRLREIGLKQQLEPGASISQIDKRIILIENRMRIDYAGPVAGLKKGHYKLNGKRVLVTQEAKLFDPSPGKCPIIDNYHLQLFNAANPSHRQLERVLPWLARFYDALRRSELYIVGQALFLVGDRNDGKSFWQHHILTPLFGGRAASPFEYLNSTTGFNGELIGCEHLLFGDESLGTDIRRRKAFGARLKGWIVGDLHYFHSKHKEALNLPASQRVTVSINDDADNICTLPPWEANLYDKFLITRTSHVTMPCPTVTSQQRLDFRQRILDEMPAFCRKLLNDVQVPDDMNCERFGVASWSHPDVMETLNQASPETPLLEIIDQTLWPDRTDIKPWEGSAEDLRHALLKGDYSDEAKRTLYWQNSTGTYLGKLANRDPRFQNIKTKTKRFWRIESPHLSDKADPTLLT